MKISRFMAAAAAAVVAAGGLLAFGLAKNAGSPPAPVIAVVDLSKAINTLDEWKDLTTEFEAKKQDATKKLQELQKKIKAEDENLKLLPAGSPDRRAVVEKGARLLMEFRVEEEFQKVALDQMLGDMLRDIYSRLDSAAEELAKKSGYTMVLASDERVEIKRGASEDVSRTISLKRMMYVDHAHDITDELIKVMNNRYAANKGKKN